MAKLKCFVGRRKRDGTVNVEFDGQLGLSMPRQTFVVQIPVERIEIVSRRVVRRGLLNCRKTFRYNPNVGMNAEVAVRSPQPIKWLVETPFEIPTASGSTKSLYVNEGDLED